MVNKTKKVNIKRNFNRKKTLKIYGGNSEVQQPLDNPTLSGDSEVEQPLDNQTLLGDSEVEQPLNKPIIESLFSEIQDQATTREKARKEEPTVFTQRDVQMLLQREALKDLITPHVLIEKKQTYLEDPNKTIC